MFCNKCGTMLKDDAKFCPNCGNVVELPDAPIAEQPEVPVAAQTDAPIVERTVMPDPEPAFSMPEVPKKKKLPGWGLGCIIAGAVAVVGLAVWAVISLFSPESALKMAMSDPEDYYGDQEFNNIEQVIDNVTSMPGDIDNFKLAGKVSLKVTEEGVALIEDISGRALPYKLGGTSVALGFTAVNKDGNAQVTLNGDVNGSTIVDGELLVDMENRKLYLKVPILSDQYAMTELEIDEEAMKEAQAFMESDAMTKLPDLLKKYLKIVFENVPEMDKTTEEYTVEGVSEKLTVFSVDISAELVGTMLIPAIEELQKDDEAIAVIRDFMNAAGEDLDAEEVEDYIDILLSDLEDASDEEVATIKILFNSGGKMVGREIEIEDGPTVLMVSLTDGGKMATEARISAEGQDVVFSGIAKCKGDMLSNGEYTLEFDGTTLLNVNLERYDLKKAEEGNMDAKFSLSIGDSALKMVNPEVSAILKPLSLSFEIIGTETSSNMTVTVNSDDKALVELGLELSISEGSEIKIPTGGVTLEEYGQTVSTKVLNVVTELKERLEKAGVDKNLLNDVMGMFIATDENISPIQAPAEEIIYKP